MPDKRQSMARSKPRQNWSSDFADTSPYRPADPDEADDSDCADLFDIEWDFEPDDPSSNLDLSRRVDYAQFTSTPFTIAAKQADSTRSRNRSAQVSNSARPAVAGGPFLPIPAERTIEELLAEQEAADRRGGKPLVPALEQKLPAHDNKKNGNNEWAWRNHGWVDGKGQPVAASRTPANPNQPKIVDALDKIDKGPAKAKGRKKKAVEPEPQLLPPPKPKTIAERLDDIEKGEESEKGKKKAPAVKKATGQARKAKPAPAKSKGKKALQDKEEEITFGMLPSGAAKNGNYPIVQGFNKMKELPVKTKAKRPSPPSPASSPEHSLARLDVDEMVAKANASSDRKAKRSTAAQKDRPTTLKEIGDGDVEKSSLSSDERSPSKMTVGAGRTSSTYFDLTHDEPELPVSDRLNRTKLTDHRFTPHSVDQYSGNPSTITHVSNFVPYANDERSSLSQLPYSSPAHQRAQRGLMDRLASPRPVRAGSRDVVNLERMATNKALPVIEGKTGFIPPIAVDPRTQRLDPPVPSRQSNARRSRQDWDNEIDLERKDEEWSTLPSKHPRKAYKSRFESGDRYAEHRTPSHQIPKFRQPSNPVVPKANGRMTFKPTPRNNSPALTEEDSGPGYRLSVIPNRTKDIDPPSYQVAPMQWTGAQQRQMPAGRREIGGDDWVKQVKRARTSDHNEERAWQDEWKAQNRREIEDNRHARYAYHRPTQRSQDYEYVSGRAFG